MNTVVERALANLAVAVEDSQAEIIVRDLPELCVDPIQMTQLLQNLIGNAIKYRQKDKQPHIKISAKKQKHAYIFSVTDDGIGIDKKHFDRVFTIFQRLHTRSEYPGTGVGLTICRKIIDRHGGEIWVEANQKQGSTFLFSVPVERR